MPKDIDLTSKRISFPDSLDELEAINDFLLLRKMTDGLPVVPPTERRVRAFIEYARRRASEVIAVIPPANHPATAEKLAVNAVMAGCKPEYMPIVLAAVEAMTEPQFNLNAIQSTSAPAGPMLIINGPIRHEISLNCSSGLLGPGWRANASIGRAIRLILMNLGGAVPGTVDLATQGWPGKYSLCAGELEEENPWEPLHVERGFRRDESTVTVLGVQGTNAIVEASPDAEDVIKTIEHALVDTGCNNFHTGLGEPALLLCPTHAQLLKRLFPTKNHLKKYLWEKVRAPVEWFSRRYKERPGFLERVVDGTVPMIPQWEDYMVLIGGGPGGFFSTFLPTFGDSLSVTRRIGR
ncbi:MAG: hypothetical protein Q7T26_08035 [Dehalococcoidia bacterium]|nr:hypothetical protein [Dehalococcoidia bacterium]